MKINRKMRRLLTCLIAIIISCQGALGLLAGFIAEPALSMAYTESNDNSDSTNQENTGSEQENSGDAQENTVTTQENPANDGDNSGVTNDSEESKTSVKDKNNENKDKDKVDEDKTETTEQKKEEKAEDRLVNDNLVNGANLKLGEVIKKKTLIRMDNSEFEGIYLDGTKLIYNYKEEGTEGYILSENAMVIEKENYLKLETVNGKGYIISEEGLRAVLGEEESITLHGNILLTSSLVIEDGKKHIIDLNGFTLDNSKGIGSVIKIKNGTDLIIKDSSNDQTGEICGGEANEGGGICVESGKFEMIGGSITLNSAISGGAIYAYASTIVKLNDVNISQNNQKRYELDKLRKSKGGGLYISEGAECKIMNCDIITNYSESAGGIYNEGKLTVNNSLIKGNIALGIGGGLRNEETVTITDSSIVSNISKKSGAGIYNDKNMTIKDCKILENSGISEGGGIYTTCSSTTAKVEFDGKNNITGNSASIGGGICFYSINYSIIPSNNTLSNMDISNNYASDMGGGLYIGNGLSEFTIKKSSINNNISGNNGGGIATITPLSIIDTEIMINTSENNGGGIYTNFQNYKKSTGTKPSVRRLRGASNVSVTNLTIKSSIIQGNICYGDGGAGIWMEDTKDKTNFILGGGKTVIYMNSKASKDENSNSENDSDIFFNVYRDITVTGKFEKNSMIGFNYKDTNFSKKEVTKGYSDHNNVGPNEYFYFNGTNHRVSPDSKLLEVTLIEKMKPSASGYKVRVQVKVTDDADDWDDAHIDIYCKRENGVGGEFKKHSTGEIKGSLDDDGDVYDNTFNCGSDFPSKINVYANFGGGLVHRVWQADVKVWINNNNVKTYHIVRDLWGNTAKKGQADNYVNIDGNNYPYPDEIEVYKKNEIDILNDNSKEVSFNCIDQYGVSFKASGKDNFKIENISFPKEDTYESLDNYGQKWKFDTTKKDCHNSIYVVKFKSGSNIKKWVEVPVSVRFKIPLKLTVKVGDKVVLEKSGYQNDTVEISGIKAAKGYRITGTEKSGLCVFQAKETEGEYSFTFLSENVEINFSTSPIRYYIKFDKNASSSRQVTGNISKLEAYYNEKGVLPTCPYTSKKGYIFSGWNTEKDGSGKEFKDGATFENLLSTHRESLVLYAQWKNSEGKLVSASIFSNGTLGIWICLIIMLFSVVGVGCYVSVKKRRI